MTAMLRRQDLVWISGEGWQQLLRDARGPQEAACLRHWFEQRLPLVVGRQPLEGSGLVFGLPAPQVWERRKIALVVPRHYVLYHGQFPRANDIASLLPPAARSRWAWLWQSLRSGSVDVRVHGSYGWQRMTGLRYLTARSDVDLLMPVFDSDIADRVVALLEQFEWPGPRIDGELLFPNGSAVAWREWVQWRRGMVDRILVKRLYGVTLESGREWLEGRSPVAA